MTLDGLTLAGGESDVFDGAIRTQAANLTIANCTITGNASPGGSGGGIFVTGNLTIIDSTISENGAFYALAA